MSEGAFPRAALLATGGLLVWAANFLVIYVHTALACERGHAHSTLFGVGVLPLASIIATSVSAAACGVLLVQAWRRANTEGGTPGPRLFLARLGAIVTLLALVAIAILGIPGLVVANPCETQ